MVKVDWKLSTCGDGYWSDKSKTVAVTALRIGYINGKQDFGELCVHFDPKTWDVRKDGLIYTDSEFLSELHYNLEMAGFDPTKVDYSEQGMQGDDYVSLDVGKQFLDSWFKTVTVEA